MGCCAPFLTFDGPSRPLSLEKKLGIADAGVMEISRGDAFVPGRQLENGLGSAMQTAGRRFSRQPGVDRETGRRKTQRMSEGALRGMLDDSWQRLKSKKGRWNCTRPNVDSKVYRDGFRGSRD